ncbi:MAG: class I SAM-dependent methyltransferase [Candidatus Gastranaerophilales bacterium]|nr:class I SAM-dependent methyltransferase [Candidatus Gastranaerophilales bacterium]
MLKTRMSVDNFFEILIKEMDENKELRDYHRLFKNPSFFELRKAYFCQRLRFLIDQIKDPNVNVWDLGCGHGTTSFFLAMNGIKSHGTTIGDHYFTGISKRRSFWDKYGDTSLFTTTYENLFDSSQADDSYDYIILQDTLHHLEPVQQVFSILHKNLRTNGKIIILEANGGNFIHQLKLFCIRGNKRIIEVYDHQLKKNLLYGNENFRSIKQWQSELKKQNFIIENNVQYIKFFPQFFYNGKNTEEIINLEKQITQKWPTIKENLFFGMNFVAAKN